MFVLSCHESYVENEKNANFRSPRIKNRQKELTSRDVGRSIHFRKLTSRDVGRLIHFRRTKNEKYHPFSSKGEYLRLSLTPYFTLGQSRPFFFSVSVSVSPSPPSNPILPSLPSSPLFCTAPPGKRAAITLTLFLPLLPLLPPPPLHRVSV